VIVMAGGFYSMFVMISCIVMICVMIMAGTIVPALHFLAATQCSLDPFRPRTQMCVRYRRHNKRLQQRQNDKERYDTTKTHIWL
jgi:hypothetical protein